MSDPRLAAFQCMYNCLASANLGLVLVAPSNQILDIGMGSVLTSEGMEVSCVSIF